MGAKKEPLINSQQHEENYQYSSTKGNFIRFRPRNAILLLIITIAILLYGFLYEDGGLVYRQSTHNTSLAHSSCKVRHLAYIKTHKTGSSTIANIMYRQAIRWNLTVLVYSYQMYINNKKTLMYPIHFHPQFTGISDQSQRFDYMMEHVPHNDEMLFYMMPQDTVFITSLRHPLEQLKSEVHYTHRDRQGENPVMQFVNSSAAKNYEGMRFFQIPQRFTGSPDLRGIYSEALKRKFPFAIITDYFDESLLLLKRRNCWELEDILYLPLKVGDYDFSENVYDEKILSEKLKSYNGDKELFNVYNNSLWELIRQEKDFFQELYQFRSILEKVLPFGKQIESQISLQKSYPNEMSIQKILTTYPSLRIEGSKWNKPFVVEPIDIMLMLLDKRCFRGLFIQRQNPDICLRNDIVKPGVGLKETSLTKDGFSLNKSFCDTNTLKYGVPAAVLNNANAYDLFH